MVNIALIVKTLDDYLDSNNLKEITAVEANKVLEKAGILTDSSNRSGLPLRNLLRTGKVPTAEYRIKPGNKRGRWFIIHS